MYVFFNFVLQMSVYHPVGLPISPQRMAARWQVRLLTVILTQGRVLITA